MAENDFIKLRRATEQVQEFFPDLAEGNAKYGEDSGNKAVTRVLDRLIGQRGEQKPRQGYSIPSDDFDAVRRLVIDMKTAQSLIATDGTVNPSKTGTGPLNPDIFLQDVYDRVFGERPDGLSGIIARVRRD